MATSDVRNPISYHSISVCFLFTADVVVVAAAVVNVNMRFIDIAHIDLHTYICIYINSFDYLWLCAFSVNE